MPNQEAKAHRVGEWASLRNTSPEIAEAIFELANYDEKLAEKIWEEGSDEVLPLAFAKTDKDSLFWGEQTIERKNVYPGQERSTASGSSCMSFPEAGRCACSGYKTRLNIGSKTRIAPGFLYSATSWPRPSLF